MKLKFKAIQQVENAKSVTVIAPFYGMEIKTGEAMFVADTETLEVDCLVKGSLTDEGVTNTKNTIKVMVEVEEVARKDLPQARCPEPIRGPWWDFMSSSFYQGLIFPFLCFGAVVTAVVASSWLLRLIQNCF